jgi:hypothetical protein
MKRTQQIKSLKRMSIEGTVTRLFLVTALMIVSLVEELYRQIGQQKVELDWLKKKSGLAD